MQESGSTCTLRWKLDSLQFNQVPSFGLRKPDLSQTQLNPVQLFLTVMQYARIRPRCPRCASPLHRRHRSGLERIISNFCNRRPFYCSRSHCTWRGWLPFSDEPRSQAAQPIFIPQVEIVEEGKWQRLTSSTLGLHYLPSHGSTAGSGSPR